LNECQKIESALWDYNSLSTSRKAEIDSHLLSCARCRQAAETIRAIGESAVKTKDSAAAIDPQAFDREVMRKIAVEKVISVTPLIESRQNHWRMAVSFVMAAAVVLIMVKSVGDLDNFNPRQLTQIPDTEEKRYGRINIELAPPEQPTKKAETSVRDLASAPKQPADKIETPSGNLASAPEQLADYTEAPASKFASSPEQTTGALAERDSSRATEFALNAPTRESSAPPTIFSAKAINAPVKKPRQQEEVFSILPAPVTSPDSINIDAVYVSNENISLHQQASAASLTELYADTAAVQSVPLQMSRVVTIEKMPQPLRIEVPEYPVWAKKRGISGTVWIKARVTSDGKISDALVLSCDSKGAGFEEAALEAARNNLFVPASSNGMNLSVWVVYPVKFINKN